MSAVIFTLVIIAIILCFSYAKPIYYRYKRHKYKKQLDKQISLLPALYEKCLFYRTAMFGLLGSHNESVPFEKVHRNQELAIASVLSLITQMEPK